ncbi:hypothetical protein [Dyella japonica]|uniref:Uncharacterized protein n=1 Tax=Dyella japonica DSM 16301 TaxID=1440762 RepID=A0A0G9H1N3_9GAMM|nr:hypothetical protein [Dyella japonica]KLD63416.1 hypothetical protein Y882_11625 [Dyella japonica DSM 16301]
MKKVSGSARPAGFVCAIFMLLLAASAGASQLSADNQAPLPGQRFVINAAELPKVRDQADRGDVVAIRRMADYYLIYEADDAQGIYWLERLGDTGDIEARNNVVEYYTRHPSPANTKRLKEVRTRWGM